MVVNDRDLPELLALCRDNSPPVLVEDPLFASDFCGPLTLLSVFLGVLMLILRSELISDVVVFLCLLIFALLLFSGDESDVRRKYVKSCIDYEARTSLVASAKNLLLLDSSAHSEESKFILRPRRGDIKGAISGNPEMYRQLVGRILAMGYPTHDRLTHPAGC